MTLESIFLLAILLCLLFTSDFITRGHQRPTEKQLVEISNQYSGITWKYWGWSIVLVVFFGAIVFASMKLSTLYPLLGKRILFFSVIVAVAFIPLFQALFALATGVYPMNKYADFVLADRPQIEAFAFRSIAVVFLVLGVALIYTVAGAVF